MLDTLDKAPSTLRVVHRVSLRSDVDVFVRTIRPSLLDFRLAGDPWVLPQGGETCVLCFGDRQLASVAGLTLDLPSLNQRLDSLRHRPPRRRCWRSAVPG